MSIWPYEVNGTLLFVLCPLHQTLSRIFDRGMSCILPTWLLSITYNNNYYRFKLDDQELHNFSNPHPKSLF